MGLIVVYLFRVLFEYSRSYLLVVLGQRMSMAVMLQYFKHVLTLPMNFFATRKSGEIISRFLDANKIIDALASATFICFFRYRYGAIGRKLPWRFKMERYSYSLWLHCPFYVVAILAFVKSYEKANQEEMAAGATLNSKYY